MQTPTIDRRQQQRHQTQQQPQQTASLLTRTRPSNTAGEAWQTLAQAQAKVQSGGL
ncbi:MAG: hypothetical protein H6R15_2491 [Proteobacteria bacterium]|nr:hypothetical protein [Pseudomonadota bacterium]